MEVIRIKIGMTPSVDVVTPPRDTFAVGDTVMIYQIKNICYGFDAVTQRYFHVGSLHRVAEVDTLGCVLEGNPFLAWTEGELKKV